MNSFEALLESLYDKNPLLISAVREGYEAYLEAVATDTPAQQAKTTESPDSELPFGYKVLLNRKLNEMANEDDGEDDGNADKKQGEDNKEEDRGAAPEVKKMPLNTSDFSFLNERITPWIGTPYRWGGKSLGGVDCSGFVISVFPEISNYPQTRENSAMLLNSPTMKDIPTNSINSNVLQKGDILFFKTGTTQNGPNVPADHIAIYLGNGNIAHAKGSAGVVVEQIPSKYNSAFVRARRPVQSVESMADDTQNA